MKSLSDKEIDGFLSSRVLNVLVTDDLSGHRIEWLGILISILKKRDDSLLVICDNFPEAENLKNYDFDRLHVYIPSTGIRSINKLLNSHSQNHYMFWDADNKLPMLIKANYRANCLIMRPYITEIRLKSFFKFLIKSFFMALIRISGKHNLKNLAIFGSVPRIFSHQWVDDELMLSEGQKFEEGHDGRDSAIQILVPGFISHRKNPLEAISACAELRNNYGFKIDLHFKGSVTPDVLNEIKNTGHSWVFVDDVFLGRNEYLESLRRADLVLLPYANRGSSGVVLETLAIGGSVAIYGNRHWKNLSLISRGKLILLKRGKTGIVRSLSRKLNALPGDRRPIKFERTRDSALEFLTRKRID